MLFSRKIRVLFLVVIVLLIAFLPEGDAGSLRDRIRAALQKKSSTLGPGQHKRTIQYGGLDRSFNLYVPSNYDGKKPMPVVLVFHGGGGNAASIEEIAKMDDKAERAGFIVVYPDGTGRFKRMLAFNAGQCCGEAAEKNIDDVGFTNAILDDLEKGFVIDTKRIYCTGISNGGMLCYRLACQLADRIAAIAPIAASKLDFPCPQSKAVSVIHFHGADDDFVPIAGGRGKNSPEGVTFNPLEKNMKEWAERNECKNKDIFQDKDYSGTIYKECLDNSEVVMYLIKNAGHTWPGGVEMPERKFGQTSKGVSANDIMWDFFQKHPMK